MKKIMIASVFWAMSGCASHNNGTEFSLNSVKPKNDVGTVVFYRPSPDINPLSIFFELGVMGRVGTWDIFADDQKVALLENETFTIVELPPGQYKFNGPKLFIKDEINVQVKPAAVQYIKAYKWGYSLWSRLILEETDYSMAKNDLKDMKLLAAPNNWKYTLSHSD